MNSYIRELEELTLHFLSRLDFITFEDVEEFVEGRQKLIGFLLAEVVNYNVSSEMKVKIRALLEFDSVIYKKMEELKNEAMDWIQKRTLIKTQRNAYENPYSSESFLLDRRK
ncbi:hypothetical protein QPK24_21605 [Paenibacillus polygoni]|uniref:Flagellar protein FliT n=1 Tax=Paenibacillus polygoni TaxID=3050112 RepID=A0ABY8X1K1_9BACL|nr:hypothetical protein [Paenibacillus polygoni]WIV18888.1 hypothetical protein QPK24_21605 [Paenibacillus polygoni]